MNGRLSRVGLFAPLLLLASTHCDAPPPEVGSSRRLPAPELIEGEAPVAPFVAQQLSAQPERPLVVYVGATWCEPCQHFHDALERGELDDALRGVRFVEYDLDESRQALRDGGYTSRLIPLFVVPQPDGRASGQRMEGSIKGPEAVEKNLLPRLKQLGL